MAETTRIYWTDSTFNPWRGCSKISPGCENCYAATMSKRNPGTLGVWGPNGTRVVASEAMWREPLKWDREADCCCGAAGLGPTSCEFCAGGSKRHRVFCASLADVFEDWQGPMVDSSGQELSWDGLNPVEMNDVRLRLFDLIDATPNLDWQILTKRPENILRMTFDSWCKPVPGRIQQNKGDGWNWKWPFNLWLGVSVENQEQADKRIPLLLQVPANVRFLSCEPLLGPVDLRPWLYRYRSRASGLRYKTPGAAGDHDVLPGIDWVIVGGESGHHRRPMKIEWAESVRDQCRAAGVAFFMKQMEINGKVETDIEKFPAGLRVREFPESVKCPT